MSMWFVAAACAALLPADPASANGGGLTTSSFSTNELRTGFARLFRNGVEQPFPYSFPSYSDFGSTTPDPLLQQFRRPAPFGPQLSPTFGGRPRFYPPRGGGGGGGKGFGGGGGGGFGGRRPNDVLVIVVKTNKNCTNEGNGTDSGNKPADGGGGDDDDDDDDEEENQGGLNPDDEVESVNVVAGGAEGQKEPSRCVWAILACCAPANSPIRYTCFDVLGCSTAFWDTNPCVPEIVKAVLGQASTFLNGGGGGNGKGNETTTTTAAPPAPADPPAEAASENMAALATAIVAAATATPLAVDVTPPASA